MTELERYRLKQAKRILRDGIEDASRFLKMEGAIEIGFVEDIDNKDVISLVSIDFYSITYNSMAIIEKSDMELYLSAYIDVMHVYHYLEITISCARDLMRYHDSIETIEVWEKEYAEMEKYGVRKVYDCMVDAVAFGAFYLKLMKNKNAEIPKEYAEEVNKRIEKFKNIK